jgi:hypothetical protein
VQHDVNLTVEQRKTYAAGDDTVTNDGDVDATATSLTTAVGLGVGVDGNAAVKVSSTAQANADGVDLGGGNDSLISTGDLTVSSDATANALSLVISAKTSSTTPSGSSGSAAATPAPTAKPLKAVANGSATSTARATGIDGDSGVADSLMSLRIEIDSLESISISGLRSDTRVGGNDNVINHGAIDATATAISRAASGSLAINAAATANVTSTAAADATGIDLGAGDDTLNNTGNLVATSDARAQALAVAVGIESSSDSSATSGAGSGSTGAAAASGSSGSGAAATTPKPPTFDSAADASAKAEARATGIGGDSHAGDTIDSIGLSLSSDNGLSIQYSNLSTRQSGNDAVINDGDIDTRATAATIVASVAFTMKGSASANTASTTDAKAIAIDLGGGQDTATNTGDLTALADSTAFGLSADIVAKKGGSGTSPSDVASSGFWQGGTKAEATATGIDAAGTQTSETRARLTVNSDGLNVLYETRKDNVGADAADIINNSGSIDATANATATAVNASASAEGKAAAVTHSDSKADAAGIIGGAG